MAGGGGGGGLTNLDCRSLTFKRPTYQILASCYAMGGGWWWSCSEFSVRLWSEASA